MDTIDLGVDCSMEDRSWYVLQNVAPSQVILVSIRLLT